MAHWIRLQIPGLPKTTNSGGRTHWAIKVKEANQWKRAVRLSLIGKAPPKPFKKANVYCTRHSSGSLDYDGLVSSFKHILDGLIEGGVIENDKTENIGIPSYLHVKAPRNKGWIEVIVEEIIPVPGE